MAELKFNPGDDVSVSDLRKVEDWTSRLSESGKLRLRRRGEVVAVLLSPSAWRELAIQSGRYDAALRFLEDERDQKIIEARKGGNLLRGKVLREALGRELKKAGLL
jgi:hypothetical protein